MANYVDGDASYDDFLTNNAYAGAASASLSSRSIYVNIVDPTSWSTSGSYDSYGDWYFSDVSVHDNGSYNINSSGGTQAYIWDENTNSWLYSSENSWDRMSHLHMSSGIKYRIYVYGYTDGVDYTVTVTPSTSDGSTSSPIPHFYIYPNVNSSQSFSGQIDADGDWAVGEVYLTSSGYYDISSSDIASAYIYDATDNTWHSNDRMYLQSSHRNYVFVSGAEAGDAYTVTVKPNMYRDSTCDLTTSDTLYTGYSGYQSIYGTVDYSGDTDYASLVVSSSGYYDVTTSTNNTGGFVYDASTGTCPASSTGSYDTNVYLSADHANYVVVSGNVQGETYKVTVSSIDSNASDLTGDDTIYPSNDSGQKNYGHIDYAGDVDYCSIALSSSGYYNILSSGSTYSFVYDATTGNTVYASNGGYSTNVYLDSSHANYAVVSGSTAGENYGVKVSSTSQDFPAISNTYNSAIEISKDLFLYMDTFSLAAAGDEAWYKFTATETSKYKISESVYRDDMHCELFLLDATAGTGSFFSATTDRNEFYTTLYSGHQYYLDIHCLSPGGGLFAIAESR